MVFIEAVRHWYVNYSSLNYKVRFFLLLLFTANYIALILFCVWYHFRIVGNQLNNDFDFFTIEGGGGATAIVSISIEQFGIILNGRFHSK